MTPTSDPELIDTPDQPLLNQPIAAIDLGSNSFHMVVAQVQQQQMQIIDRHKEMVRLGGGFDADNALTPAARQAALDCLSRFGERLAGFAPGTVRAVGTNTLRRARNTKNFLSQAEAALGHPIDVISGIEEARLIYQGVRHDVSSQQPQRLVMDIGGGSTEIILGHEAEPLLLNSLYMGCVSYSQTYFKQGQISKTSFQQAVTAAMQELEPVAARYKASGWNVALGTSGTINTIAKIIDQQDLISRKALNRYEQTLQPTLITRHALDRLVDQALAFKQVDKIQFDGLSAERQPVFIGGLAILVGLFNSLDIEYCQTSKSALREGLLYELWGRIEHRDIRQLTIDNMAQRFRIDQTQAQRVRETALQLLQQRARDEQSLLHPQQASNQELLSWAATLHEIGLIVAHSQYHKHGAYLLDHADMPGFSQQEQHLIAVLISSHRRRFKTDVIAHLPSDLQRRITRLAVLLRLAVILCRDRSDQILPALQITSDQKTWTLSFPEQWLETHPLTAADLMTETEKLRSADIQLSLN